MQDLKSSISIEMSFVKVYLEDIQKVLEILSELSPTGFTLQAENKSFNIDEIKDLKKEKIKDLKILAHFAEDYYDISISFNEYGTSIYCVRNTNEIFGVSKKVEDYLKKKSRFFDFLAKNYRSAGISGFLLPIVGVMSGIIFWNVNQSVIFIVIYCLLSFLFIFSFYITTKYKNIIVLKEKKECKNWFIKNQDQLLIQLLIGIFLIFLGILIGPFFNKK